MGFDILSLKRNSGQQDGQKSKADAQGQRAELKYIDVYDLVPSDDNFYSMSAIEELAALIELAGGVKQPGLAVPLGGGKYKVLAGHRRRLASIFLVEQGKEQYRKMPCMLESDAREEPQTQEEAAEAEELREINEGILLIATNSQREKTDWDKVEEATRLRALLARKREFQKVPGNTREIIAEQLKTTPAQIGRYESVAKHLLPEFKEEMKSGRVNISVAYELSTLPESEQKKALAEFAEKGALSIDDVKRRQKELRENAPLPGQLDIDGKTPVPLKNTNYGPTAEARREEESKKTEDEQREQEETPTPSPLPRQKQSEEQEEGARRAAEAQGEETGPQETRCIDAGICPHCGKRFNAAEAVNYSTQGTQASGPVPCPHCGKPVAISCSVEYFCSAPED